MYRINVQKVSTVKALPKKADFTRWIKTALETQARLAEITLRIVDETESQTLNYQYRKKNYPTNVLAFPIDVTATNVLGDIVVCAPVVLKESLDQDKTAYAHFAHMVIHGTLHLLGYDHESSDEAEKMEQLETAILNNLGFENPY